MKSATSWLKWNNAYWYLFYHVISIWLMLQVFGKPDTYGGGPCNAGLGLLIYMPILLTSLVLAIVSAVRLKSERVDAMPIFWVNLVAFCFLIVLIFVRF